MPSRARKSNRSRIPVSSLHEDLSRRTDASLLSGSEGTFVIERDKLRHKLEKLRNHASTPKDQLDGEHAALFKEVVGAMKNLYGTSLYPVVMGDIADVFKSVDSRKMLPGTVHSFFLGCTSTKDSHSEFKPGCDPKCASGLPDPNLTVCDDTFLSLKDDKLVAYNSKKTTHAYIFIQDRDFRGFTAEHIEDMKRTGISKASLIRVKEGDGNKDQPVQYDTTEAVSVDILPRRSTPPPEPTSSWIIWSIIIVIALLFLGAALWYTFSSTS